LVERLVYQEKFDQVSQSLSKREMKLLEPLGVLREEESENIKEQLTEMGFVKCEAGNVVLGQEKGLPCIIEGRRENETPQREFFVDSFYISKTTVTNKDFELFDSRHARTNTSLGDKNPVTCVTYGRAISYALWLNRQTGLKFCLPTEPQLTKALAPYGWEYPYKQSGKPERSQQNLYKSYLEFYPEGESGATLEVDDPRVPTNYLGICHPTGNVSVFTFGHYIASPGHWGAEIDGSYTIAMGGNFRLCPYGSRVVSRGIVDVVGISDTIGIRLVHPDPDKYVEE